MADYDGEQEQHQDDVTDIDDNMSNQGETPDENNGPDDADANSEGDADDEVVITIGEEAPPHDEVEKEAAPAWVKDLRKADREKAREIRELKQQLAAKAAPQEAAPVLGVKPTLESVDYDTDRFETELTAWHEKKRSVEAETAKKQKEVEDQQAEFNGKLTAYKTAAKELKVSDFADSEAVVSETFSVIQQQIMLDAVSTPAAQAQLVSVLGKNEDRLKQLASIKNPIKFAIALSDLEKQLKVTNRKAPPPPEKVLRGSAAAVGVNDPKLARLEAAADKSGDRTELVAYKKALKAKAA